jgi:dGTPase
VSTGTTPTRWDRRSGSTSREARSEFQRDRDRVLYNTGFLRLAEVTQVVGPEETGVFHNRLTHSLKVAQVARRLAERVLKEQARVAEALGGVDPDVTEAAALAHDIGHPPFGHVAEQELDRLLVRRGFIDGFEGNAQSFRVVTRLAAKRGISAGLDLTRATLNALLKYPWQRATGGERQRKWGAYSSEADELAFARELHNPGDEEKCAEAELMDWADDVTYAVHDMVDFYRAGLIPMERLVSPRDETERGIFLDSVFRRVTQDELKAFSRTEFEQAFEGLVAYFTFDRKFIGTRTQEVELTETTSILITRYASAIWLREPTTDNRRRVEIEPERYKEVFMLKQLTWQYVISNPLLTTQQHGLRRMIRGLFEILYSAAKKGNFLVFPFGVRERFEPETGTPDPPSRIIADYIAGMTEQETRNIYLRLTGISPVSALH